MIKCYPANGKTYRLEADQNAPHPSNSHPKAIVEACGNPSNFGFVNTVPQDDADLFIETFCMTVIGSFDPNDKQVSPVGITSNQYITAEDELEYLIRFQNTGTDTAFKVVIRDTIATDVIDIATLTSGASSHDYTFNVYGHGIAEWTFDNILLPDSNVNEPESHGFVQFKIKQLPGNPDGTRIENRAAIYFDFNVPVITNTAWNEVNEGEMPVSLFSSNTISPCPTSNGGLISVTASGGLVPYSYQWSNGETGSTISNLSQGIYSVTVSDAAESVFIDSIIIAEPLIAFINTQDSVTCYGGNDASAKAIATGGISPYNFEWSNGETSSTIDNLAAGNYLLTVTDSNSCFILTSITIQDGYEVNTGSIAGEDTADMHQTLSYNVNAGFNYTWSVTNGTIISGENTDNVEVEWGTAGQGSLQVIANDQGCAKTVTKTVTVIDPTGIQSHEAFNNITIIPNPAQEKSLIQWPAEVEVNRIILSDICGKQLLQAEISNTTHYELSLKLYNTGIYLVTIKGNGQRTMRVVKVE